MEHPDHVAARIRIVLVGTQHPGNIGSAARAMKTMGLSRLVLVAPERAPDATVRAPGEAAARTVAAAADGADAALVFGRERTGLDNDELQLCHAAVHIPADPAYSSLNLAAAVQVLAYETRLALLGGTHRQASPGVGVVEPGQATHAEMEGFFAQLAETLEAIDFHKGRAPASALRKLRRLYLRAAPTAAEVRLLRGVLADAQRMARLAGQNPPELR